MKKCAVCAHAYRENIERALFRAAKTKERDEVTLSDIAEEFDVPVADLQRHAVFHSALGTEDSLIRQIHMREADVLAETVMDNALMVKSVGSRLRASMDDSDPDSVTFERRAMKSVVDLYVGSSEGVRKGVAAIADINQLLNGPKDDGLSGLTALANVLHGSQAGNSAAHGDTLSGEE